MKKKIISLIITTVCVSSCFVGCSVKGKFFHSDSNNVIGNMIFTGDVIRYENANYDFEIAYDKDTKIVYMINPYNVVPEVRYNKDKQPMTLDEYNENK